MAPPVHYFGIRHHGPGSARRLVEALDALGPAAVLIEGPADLSDLLPWLAHEAMEPPVALLAYAADDPGRAVFWPFAEYSPEYRAALWAHSHGVPMRFIDMPAAWRLVAPLEPEMAGEEPDDGDAEGAETEEAADAAEPPQGLQTPYRADPIGMLARAAGYDDGESWWRDVIEENPDPGPIFAAVADAMAALREETRSPDPDEDIREAHMRLEIARAVKETDGPVAVVCGAWHVPALMARVTAKDDRATIKGHAKTKIAATWAPWTAPRLAMGSGYGAGVVSPGWCAHLWREPAERVVPGWLARIARALREKGQVVSTASLIEAERLSRTLAALRERPAPGFEEMREAAIATLCNGEVLVWRTIADELLIGSGVGAIPDDTPLAPLLEDLQRQQKKTRLKPEALERELALDLRSDSGLARSTLLHRLTVLGVHWGKLADAGRSRGTFRERWVLAWQPEFAVELVENLVYGPTIEQAASGKLAERLRAEQGLGALADGVLSAMTAGLDAAARTGIDALGDRAAQTSDCGELLAALPPLADVIRYGEARKTPGQERLPDLMRRIAVQGALALPYAARGLDNDAAATLRRAVEGADRAVRLAEFAGDDLAPWQDALHGVLRDGQASRLVSGAAARLLYEAEELTPEATADLLGRMLSPGQPVAEAAGFFEGFFDGAGQRLIYDAGLRGAVDAWLRALDGEVFVEYLPLFRRVFSVLDASERRRLLDALFGRGQAGVTGLVPSPSAAARWTAHFARLTEILIAGARP